MSRPITKKDLLDKCKLRLEALESMADEGCLPQENIERAVITAIKFVFSILPDDPPQVEQSWNIADVTVGRLKKWLEPLADDVIVRDALLKDNPPQEDEQPKLTIACRNCNELCDAPLSREFIMGLYESQCDDKLVTVDEIAECLRHVWNPSESRILAKSLINKFEGRRIAKEEDE